MSRSSKIGLFGCSNLYGYHHAFADAVLGGDKLECLNAYLDEHVYETKHKTEQIVVDDHVIYNYAFPGCGNNFINAMIKKHIDQLDYIFVQFTGLTRIDVPGSVKDFMFQKNGWVFSGGQNGCWKDHKEASKMFADLYLCTNLDNNVRRSSAVVYETLDLIEAQGKSYNWCFYYDVEKDNKEDHQPIGLLKNKNHIAIDPHTYCFSQGKGADDGVHFMYDGYRDWLYHIKDQLHLSL